MQQFSLVSPTRRKVLYMVIYDNWSDYILKDGLMVYRKNAMKWLQPGGPTPWVQRAGQPGEPFGARAMEEEVRGIPPGDEHPGQPGHDGHPEQPGHGAHPGQPSQPAQPGQPSHTAQPGQVRALTRAQEWLAQG